jgi:predicted adenylyl cyclase CyaB
VPVNVEIKARVRDLDALRVRVQALSKGSPQRLRQDDTFFETPSGRLKLRVIDGKQGELICYQRNDECGPTPSTYQISPAREPDALKRVLSTALGVRGVVRKSREVFAIARTRVHLDRVEGLGSFLELEVVLAPGEPVERGHAEAQELLESLLVRPGDLESRAYVDMIEDAG